MEKTSGIFIGQCLHAKSLEFKHPTTGKEMNLEAELPTYFQQTILNMEEMTSGKN